MDIAICESRISTIDCTGDVHIEANSLTTYNFGFEIIRSSQQFRGALSRPYALSYASSPNAEADSGDHTGARRGRRVVGQGD